MSLNSLLGTAHQQGRGCIEIALSLSTVEHYQELIVPYLVQFPGRLLTRQEWEQARAMVDAWYLQMSDAEISEHNTNWAMVQATNQVIANLRQINKREPPREGWIYILAGGGFYKIGRTEDPNRRLAQISPKLPFEVEVAHIFYSEDVIQEEADLHERFKHQHTNGEWFKLSEDDLKWLKSQ